MLSKNDTIREVEEKVAEYLEAGVPLIWVVDPKTKQLRVYRPNSSVRLCSGDDELLDEGVLPGFRCLASELFAS